MELILQPKGSSLCGQCVVAMMTDRPLETVIEFMGRGPNYHADMKRAFKEFGYYMCDEGYNSDSYNSYLACAIFVENGKYDHWICQRDKVHDPRLGIITLKAYPEGKFTFYPVMREF